MLTDSGHDFLSELSKKNKYNFCLFSTEEALVDSDRFKIEKSIATLPSIFVCNDKDFSLNPSRSINQNSITYLDSLTDIHQVLKKIAEKLDVQYQVTEQGVHFVPIRIEYILKINYSGADVFVKLSDKKFLKMFKKGTSITAADLQDVRKKNVSILYIRLNDFENFLDTIDNFDNDYSKVAKSEISAHIAKDLSFAHEIFYHLASNFGFNKKSVSFINRSIDLLYQLIEEDKNLKSFWNLLVLKKNFLSEHSLMVGYLANAILSQTKFSTDENSIKLSMAAMIHDIELKNERFWDIEISDIAKGSFTTKEATQFQSHVHKGIELLSTLQNVPIDLDKILLNHHEKYDGTGFPHGIGWSKLPFLSTVFIVAHEFIIHMHKSDFSEGEMVKFIELKKGEYLEGNFKEVIIALEKVR